LTRVLLEKLIFTLLVKKFPAFYGSRGLLPYSQNPPLVPSLIQMHLVHNFHPLSLTYIVILFSHLRLGLPSSLFSSGFQTKILYAFLTFPIRAICPVHLILLDLATLIILGEMYTLCNSSLCSLLQPPATSSLSEPNILLSTLFSNTLSLCSSLSLRDQVSYPYKTSRIMFFYTF